MESHGRDTQASDAVSRQLDGKVVIDVSGQKAASFPDDVWQSVEGNGRILYLSHSEFPS